MNKIILSSALLLISISLHAQVHFVKKWDHTYGGTQVEKLSSLMQTADGGFILGGYTKSDTGADISEPSRGGQDMWIVKTDSLGNMQWEKRFGGSLDERLYTAEQTPDGGYILGGYTTSDSSGDISEPSRGSMDYWIVKTDSAGNKLWDKRFGGSNFDQLTCVHRIDAGYIIGGFSISDSSGDVSSNSYGSEDFWIVVTDVNGNKLWDKRYGGDFTDELYALQQTADGGFILGGRCQSGISNDVTIAPRGLQDYWIIKIDNNGVKQWDNRFGGANKDNFLYVRQNSDHGYILGGYTWSENTGDITEPTRDTSTSTTTNRGDIWLVRTDSSGNKIWDKRFGGHWVEDAFGYVNQTNDGGFLWGSASYSNMSGDKSENNFGFEQSWIVKIDSAGNKVWDKTLFVDGEDEYAYPLEVGNGCYVIANWSYGDSANYKSENSKGNYDYWIYKMCETNTPQPPVAAFTTSQPLLCEGACFTFLNQSYDAGSFEWSFPGGVPSSSTLAFPEVCYTDTGHYSVTLIATNNDGSDTVTNLNAVVVIPLTDVNIMQGNGDTLLVNQVYASYQWYLDGNPLPNDTTYFTVPQLNGDYSVTVLDSAGCPASDTVFSYMVGIREFNHDGHTIALFPNPARSEITVRGLEPVINGTLKITDITGRVVYSHSIDGAEVRIGIEQFNSGLYIIEVRNESKVFNVRFVKN